MYNVGGMYIVYTAASAQIARASSLKHCGARVFVAKSVARCMDVSWEHPEAK